MEGCASWLRHFLGILFAYLESYTSRNVRKCTVWRAPDQNSNQPLHLCNLNSVRCTHEEWRNFVSLALQSALSEDSDQTARMRSLIWIFTGRTRHNYGVAQCDIHYENLPIQIYWKFYHQKWRFSDKKFWYFSHFCSNHRLWVLVRTANEYPQFMFLSKNKKKIMYTPVNPSFTI